MATWNEIKAKRQGKTSASSSTKTWEEIKKSRGYTPIEKRDYADLHRERQKQQPKRDETPSTDNRGLNFDDLRRSNINKEAADTTLEKKNVINRPGMRTQEDLFNSTKLPKPDKTKQSIGDKLSETAPYPIKSLRDLSNLPNMSVEEQRRVLKAGGEQADHVDFDTSKFVTGTIKDAATDIVTDPLGTLDKLQYSQPVQDYVAGSGDFARNIINTVEAFGGDKIPGLNSALDYVKEETNRMSDLAGTSFWSKVMRSAPQSVNNLVLAYASGGASIPAQLGGNAMLQGIKNIVTSPTFASTMVQTFGGSYGDAIDEGQDRFTAITRALIQSVPESLIEHAGGIETIVKKLEDKTFGLIGTALQSALEEGLEEILQYPLDALSKKATYAPETPWYSTTDNAVINPGQMLESGAVGGVAGGLFGGGTKMVSDFRTGGQQQSKVGGYDLNKPLSEQNLKEVTVSLNNQAMNILTDGNSIPALDPETATPEQVEKYASDINKAIEAQTEAASTDTEGQVGNKGIDTLSNIANQMAEEVIPMPAELPIQAVEQEEVKAESKEQYPVGIIVVDKKTGKQYTIEKWEANKAVLKSVDSNSTSYIPERMLNDKFQKAETAIETDKEVTDNTEAALNKHAKTIADARVKNMKKNGYDVGPDFYNTEFEKVKEKQSKPLIEAINNKDFQELVDVLHRGNPASLNLFSEVTGLSTKTQKETIESIRSLDAKAYDAWVDEKAQASEKEKAEMKEAEKMEKEKERQRAYDSIGESKISINEKYDTFKNHVNTLFEEGYRINQVNDYGGVEWVNNKTGKSLPFNKLSKEEKAYVKKETNKLQEKAIAEDAAKDEEEYNNLSQEDKDFINNLFVKKDSNPQQEEKKADDSPKTEAISPVEEKINNLDKKLDSLIEAVSGKIKVEGSDTSVKEQSVPEQQLEVESRRGSETKESRMVQSTEDKRGSGQPSNEDGTTSGTGIQSDGTGVSEDATIRGDQQREPSNTSKHGGKRSSKPRIAKSELRGRNYRITPDTILYEGGKKTRFKNNIAAIQLLKQIESESRIATPAEQNILIKYVGWGGIAEAFDKTYNRLTGKYEGSRPDWLSEYNELRELLTDDEYNTAARSTQNAHYTHPDIINAMYKMAKKLGFKGGNVLDPSTGTGHFLGLIPDEFLSSRFLAVEKDSITGRIAKLLYPDADIRVSGFEEVNLPNNYFDMAISNVPFGDIRIYDTSYKAGYITSRIHNYFFVKALDKVKPGGAVMFITSSGTLNARDDVGVSIRRHISANADLVAAFRLPGDAFKENAGTEVTTDIIILRKRIPGEIKHGPSYENVVPIEVIGKDGRPKTLYTNEYYKEFPDNVLGNNVEDKLWTGRLAVANDGKFEERLNRAISELPSGVFNPVRGTIEELTPEQEASQIEAVKEKSYFVKNGELHQKHGNMSAKVESKQLDKMRALVEIKDAAKAVLAAQLRDVSDVELAQLQSILNKKYDAFVKKYGKISDKANARVLREDPENYLLNSLEIYNGKTDKTEKASIFSKRIVQRYQKPESANTPDEAIAISLYETGRLDMSRVADLLNLTDEEAKKALSGYAYKNPAGTWETSDEYLSGNVRQKLEEAKEAVKLDSNYSVNVTALEQVQPEDIKAADIEVKLGSSWLPTKTMQQFVADILDVDPRYISVSYNKAAGTWSYSLDNAIKHRYQNTTKYGAYGWTAVDLIEHVSNMKQPVYRYEDSEGKKVIDQEKTAALKAKADEIKEVFADWVWKDQDRRALLEEVYNDKFNAIRNREYAGIERPYPGMSEVVSLYKHQREGVERIIYGGNTLLAHGVGFGKTYIMLTGAMELKRLGIANKPMFVVPNEKLSDFQNDYKVMYPNAKILAATEDDFKPENIRALFAQIATNDWDAVIVRHSSFTRIPTSKATQEAYIREQIQEVEQAIIEAAEETDKKVTKQLEKAKENLEVRLKKMSEMKKIDLLTFEEMGIDYLIVDEAHKFKNLRTYTKLQNVKGLNTQGGPTTEDFYSKVRYVAQLHGGKRGLVFATGTPISNSLNELYTMFKYLRPDILSDSGVQHFDAWMSTFGNVENRTEIKHDGRFKPTDRFRSFGNVEELMSMFKEFADIRMDKDDVKLSVPDLEGGKPIVNESTPHPQFKKFGKSIVDRMNKLPRKPQKGEDNALSIAGDARRATTDMRLIDPAYGDYPDSKINRAVKNVLEVYKSTGERKATQMVFLGEGRSFIGTGSERILKFDAYNDIRNKLIKAGIPPAEVVFAEKYKTKEQKDQLYKDMNNGKIRVIIGSYALMGTGLNVQERLYAIHEIDVPWRPSDIEQSEGRMVRQGNLHKDWDIPVKIHRYVVASEGSFDAFMWQLQESKLVGQQKFYKGGVRRLDVEEDPNVEMVRQMKAMATGNPLVIKKVELESKLTGLRGQKKAHSRAIMESEDRIAKIPNEIAANQRYIAAMEKDILLRNIPKGEEFTVKIGNKKYANRKEAGEALGHKIASIAVSGIDTFQHIGEYAGFAIKGKGTNAILEGNAKYDLLLSGSAEGAFTSMNNALLSIENKIQAAKSRIETLNKEMSDRQADVGKVFSKEDELRNLTEELHKVNAEMEKQYKQTDSGIVESDDDVPDEFKGDTPPELDLTSEGGFIRLPGKTTPKDATYRFSDEELEAQHESAKLNPANILQKIGEWAKDFSLSAVRTYKLIDSTKAENSEFITAMVKYPKLKGIAGGRAVRILNDILRREGSVLSNEEYNLFNRYILLRDLKEEVAAEHPLPGKWTPAAVEAYFTEVESLLTENTREAVKRRDGYIEKLKQEYISSMGKLGWNVQNKFTKKNYFRHMVLEYAQARITGSGKVHVKRSRGWLKQRHGSSMLINEDYLQAEYEVMASMIHDTEVANLLRDIGNKYDIKADLKKKAKAQIDAAINKILDGERIDGDGEWIKRQGLPYFQTTTEKVLDTFKQKIAIGFSRLRGLAETGNLWDGNGEWSDIVAGLTFNESVNDESSRIFRYLSELMGTNESGSKEAAMIFKAVTGRKTFIKNLLGKNYVEWQDIIPDGYAEFYPVVGKNFYAANAITENLANALMTGNLKDVGLSDMKVQKIMAMGSPFNSFVIPEEYQTTMDDVYSDIKKGSIDNAIATFMKGWKKWQLHLNPWRFVKYNIRNLSGDFDRLMGAAGIKGVNPVYAKRAATELFHAMRFNKFTKDLIEFRELGGMQDNLYVQEIADINQAKIFKDYEKSSNLIQKVLNIPKTWDEFSSNLTEYRENILRYASYLYYKLDLQAHNGKPTFYGASLRGRIDGLSTVKDKAYQLSKDALGAYDEVSELGRWVRRYVIPFWSFQETNLKYYKRIVENTIKDDTVTEAFGKHAARSLGITVKLSTKALTKIGSIALRVSFLTLALSLWNKLVMGDDDDDLDESIRDVPHLTLGRSPNGDVLYFSRLGSLNDLLEWFNLSSLPSDIKDIAEGREEFRHLVEEMAKGPVNKLINSLTPYLKIPAELLAGMQFYPDAFKPRTIRDLGQYVSDQLGFRQEYDRTTGKPVRESYIESWINALLYRSDPEQAAYYTVLDLKNRYRKNVLKEYQSQAYNDSPKSKALYYFKLALKYGDKDAAKKYLSEYFTNSGTTKGISQSLRTLDPLYGLNDAEIGGFYEWLRVEEREALKKAYTYYYETLGSGQ